MPTIWVDADATPRAVKEMLFRAADRVQIEVVLVANQPLATPRSRFVRALVVAKGFDVADERIVDEVQAGDLVITADIPLAAAVVGRGAVCIDPRGQPIDANNAASKLAARDRAEVLRESGLIMSGPKPFGERDKRQFAGALDRWLAKNVSRRP